MEDIILLTAGYREVFGVRPRICELTEVLAGYSLEQIFAITSRISLLLARSANGLEDAAIQLSIARGILPPATFARLNLVHARHAEGRGLVIFQERQLLTLAKIACLFLDPSVESKRKELGGIGTALLMATDLIDEGIEAPLDDPIKIQRSELYFFANYHFYSKRNPLQELGRTLALYFDDKANACIKDRLDKCSRGRPDELWAALLAMHSRFQAAKVETISDPTPTLPSSYFSESLTYSEDESRFLVQHAGRPVGELSDEVRELYALDDLQPFSFLPFEKSPLVGFGARWACTSMPLLLEYLGLNFRHRLMDSRLFSADERKAFLDAHSLAFHGYAGRLLDAAFVHLGYGEREIAAAADLLGPKGQRQSHCDYVATYGDLAMLFEFKAASPILGAREGSNWEGFQRQVEQVLVESARQLTATELLVREGGFHAVDRSAVILPISITLDFSVNPLLYSSVVRNMARDSRVSFAVANRIQFFDVRDAELIEHATHYHEHGFRSLMEEKLRDPQGRAMSLTNYCVTKGLRFGNRHNKYLAETFTGGEERATRFLESRKKA